MTPSPGRPAWERGTARVLDGGRPVGVAFLIPGQLLLTCSHVVAAVAGLPEDRPLAAGHPVTVDFPLLPGRPAAAATVHFSVPVAADNSGDVAVLRLTGHLPEGAVPLRILEADDLAGHRWRAFGFPKYPEPNGVKDAGIWTRGTIEGREGTGWWQLTCDAEAGFPLAGGFSGAPVWDEQYQGVVGVVVAVEGDPRRRTGYALTVESLAREWPQLRTRLLADSPFRELLPFTEQDSAVFHGRDHEARRLRELLVDQKVPVLPVLGASGVGKSSLTGAGLLAHVDDSSHVVARLPHGLRLTAEELLAWALASAGDADTRAPDWRSRWSTLATQLRDEAGLRTALERTLARHAGRSRLLLVADQFETVLADAPETARRLDMMLGVLTARRADGSRPAQAVVVARIDFLPQIEQLPVLRGAWQSTHVVVPPMTREQLRMAVTRPLEAHAGIRYADGLVEQLLRDTPPGAAALPMLEYTLSQLWARQERGVLTATAYQELGGVEGALVGNAESTLWEWADASERAALERIFIQLVRPGEQLDAGERSPDTRRVADRAQFSAQDWSLVHRLASTRLVVVTRRSTGLDTAELAHQALVESWRRLQGWVEGNRDFRSWQESLRRTMRAWQEQGRPRALTLDRRHIRDAQRWLGLRAAEISADEVEFIRASVQAQHRAARRRRLVVAGFALLAAVVVIVSRWAVVNATSSDRQRDVAAAQRLVSQSQLQSDTDPALAARLALAAQRINATADTRAQLLATLTTPLRATLTGFSGSVTSVAFSPDGRILATASRDSTVRLWDAGTHRLLTTVTGPGRAVDSVAFSPDGRTLATGIEDGTVRLWDAHTGRPLATLRDASEPAVFSPDGKTLATGGNRGSVELWDVGTHRQVAHFTAQSGSSTMSVAFSRDGTELITGGSMDSEVRLWDIRTHRRLAALPGGSGRVQCLALSPDGSTLATGANDSTARLWDMRTHRQLAVLSGHTGTVWALAFSPDGRTLATGSDDRTVELWNVPSRSGLIVFRGHTGGVDSVAFSPDGTTLATGGEDATARLWDLRSNRPLVTFPGRGAVFQPLAHSPDGRILATGSNDGRARLWDLRTHQLLASFSAPSGGALSVAFSPDGRTLATSSAKGAVQLWDVRTHHALATLSGPAKVWNAILFSPDGRILATTATVGGDAWLWDARTGRALAVLAHHGLHSPMAFSPDGTVLAISGGSTVQLWDVRTHRRLATLTGHTGLVASIVFSPDGKTLASGSWDDTVRLWDVRTHSPLATLTGHTDSVQSVAFSPDGSTLASSSRDMTVRLWDVRTHSPLATLTGHTGIVWSVVFSPDGQTLATVSDDRTVRLWDVRTHRQLGLLVGHTDEVNSVAFSPDGRTAASSSFDGTVRLWDTSMFGDLGTLVDGVCAIAGGSMTHAEWQHYVPAGVQYRSICP